MRTPARPTPIMTKPIRPVKPRVGRNCPCVALAGRTTRVSPQVPGFSRLGMYSPSEMVAAITVSINKRRVSPARSWVRRLRLPKPFCLCGTNRYNRRSLAIDLFCPLSDRLSSPPLRPSSRYRSGVFFFPPWNSENWLLLVPSLSLALGQVVTVSLP